MTKVAIITGATRGIGYAVAETFAEKGYDLVLAGKNPELLSAHSSAFFRRYGAHCVAVPGDLEHMDYVKSIVDACIDAFGRVDVLVNNAAWRTIQTMRTLEQETWEKTVRVCLTAPAFLAKWAALEMERLDTGGTIINVSSVMSARPAGTSPAYITCKGGMDALTRELAVTFGRSRIRVVGIAPGYIDTDLSADYVSEDGDNISGKLTAELLDYLPLARPGKVREIAAAIAWLASGEAAYITGTNLTVDGGLNHNFSSYPLKKLQFPSEF